MKDKDIEFVNSKDLQTIEQYGASLISALVTLKTLESFEHVAYKKGILDEDEAETSKTICWEIQRLLALYQTQIKHIVERTSLNEQDVVDKFRTLMPNVKIPRKNKKVSEKELLS